MNKKNTYVKSFTTRTSNENDSFADFCFKSFIWQQKIVYRRVSFSISSIGVINVLNVVMKASPNAWITRNIEKLATFYKYARFRSRNWKMYNYKWMKLQPNNSKRYWKWGIVEVPFCSVWIIISVRERHIVEKQKRSEEFCFISNYVRI